MRNRNNREQVSLTSIDDESKFTPINPIDHPVKFELAHQLTTKRCLRDRILQTKTKNPIRNTLLEPGCEEIMMLSSENARKARSEKRAELEGQIEQIIRELSQNHPGRQSLSFLGIVELINTILKDAFIWMDRSYQGKSRPRALVKTYTISDGKLKTLVLDKKIHDTYFKLRTIEISALTKQQLYERLLEIAQAFPDALAASNKRKNRWPDSIDKLVNSALRVIELILPTPFELEQTLHREHAITAPADVDAFEEKYCPLFVEISLGSQDNLRTLSDMLKTDFTGLAPNVKEKIKTSLLNHICAKLENDPGYFPILKSCLSVLEVTPTTKIQQKILLHFAVAAENHKLRGIILNHLQQIQSNALEDLNHHLQFTMPTPQIGASIRLTLLAPQHPPRQQPENTAEPVTLRLNVN